ncbi:NADP-dependent oxidoreductase [Rivularia sp. UHCC 0363]|uniref:NADP-dependent oxidoreductase n=1 Tax=Rivularia sp. UHCC 0363 TaxID=3110244 RepID=UPI002B217B51|nr:NADP-dependent oxidoreductase [Rivularia sp. UHCC 0363]MEA5597009.1 NADP-dependent oxidoreductase [Rivularia sp. UHCC 0363]
MSESKNLQVLLKNRPQGEPKVSDFAKVENSIPEPADGELLSRTIYLSLDPYMRGRISAKESYADPVELDSVMVGATVSQVVQSNLPQFSEGDFIVDYNGWQTYGVSNGKGIRKLDPEQAPLSYALGVMGMPGLTAYCALLDIGQPQAGETVVVSAASGAVGSVVGQIAKIKGCRAVGVVGSDEKCNYIVNELGFDSCINRKTQELYPALKEACPDGIDVYFDNTAGAILEAVMQQINLGARIPLVGLISQYNATNLPPGPNLMPLLVKRALIKGFLVADYQDRLKAFLSDVSGWIRDGQIKYKEDVVEGLDKAARVFIGQLQGENFGKLIVRVSPDPTKK